MMNWKIVIGLMVALSLAGLMVYGYLAIFTELKTDIHTPTLSGPLEDDRIEDKQTSFDPDLIDSRPVDGWLINKSASVIKLDVPRINPEYEPELLVLHKSYKHAHDSFESDYRKILPSVNMLDGKAKQFDDGLYAAIDMAFYQGIQDQLRGHVELVQKVFDKLDANSPARAFLAAALSYADVEVSVVDTKGKEEWKREFDADTLRSKPISFYNWNPTLQQCWRFMRFLQFKFDPRFPNESLPVLNDISEVFADDAVLLADYSRSIQLYAGLTNPYSNLSLLDVYQSTPLSAEKLSEPARQKQVGNSVSFYPPSTSKETELFNRLFEDGIPANVNLIDELIRRIRSGEVDLKPRPNAGWYEHQVYALETLLLPEKATEHNKLLLTKAYKKRMLEAFKALITKRRETHARQLDTDKSASARKMPKGLAPRLRIEPNPTYFLRTAHAYAFLQNVLESALPPNMLAELHGQKADGKREMDLKSELEFIRDLFYGLHAISAEDIGMRPDFEAEEANVDNVKNVALKWLETAWDDPDVAMDTRVSIPISYDLERDVTRIWATLGVRVSKLDASFAVGGDIPGPSIRPADETEDWKESKSLMPAIFYIYVDEFAEIELPGKQSLTRKEFRSICDRAKTKEAIVKKLSR